MDHLKNIQATDVSRRTRCDKRPYIWIVSSLLTLLGACQEAPGAFGDGALTWVGLEHAKPRKQDSAGHPADGEALAEDSGPISADCDEPIIVTSAQAEAAGCESLTGMETVCQVTVREESYDLSSPVAPQGESCLVAFGNSPPGTWITVGGIKETCSVRTGDYFYQVPENRDPDAGHVLCLDDRPFAIKKLDVNFYNTPERGDFDLRLCKHCPVAASKRSVPE